MPAAQVDAVASLLGVPISFFYVGFDVLETPIRPSAPALDDGQDELMPKVPIAAACLALMSIAVGDVRPAAAEAKEVTISRLRGFSFLPLMVMEDHRLVEQRARRAGLGDLKVSYVQVNAGVDGNTALLANTVQFVGAGLPPFLTMWDRTRDNLKVRAVRAIDTTPAYLVTRNPKVHSIADFKESDRINVLAPKSALPAILLEMAAAKTFGPKQYTALDQLTVGIPPSESTSMMIAGVGDITADFLGPPFVYEELSDPKIHLVLSSKDILGETATNTLLYTTEQFQRDNPEVVAAVTSALDDAIAIIREDRASAAQSFLKLAGAKYTAQFQRMVDDPDIAFDREPHAIMKYAAFMHEIGTLKTAPESWRNLFFPRQAEELKGD